MRIFLTEFSTISEIFPSTFSLFGVYLKPFLNQSNYAIIIYTGNLYFRYTINEQTARLIYLTASQLRVIRLNANSIVLLEAGTTEGKSELKGGAG